MSLDISYFSWVRERMGIAGESLTPPDNIISVGDLVGWLAARDARGGEAFADPLRIRAALDGMIAAPATPLAGAREIALFPPVTGG